MDETTLGGTDRAFPATRWSIIRQAAGGSAADSRRALDELVRLYWKPVYAYLRATRTMSNDDAKDLTQEFLAAAIEGGFFARVPGDLASFRRYLRGALRLFLLEHRRDASAEKRGGGRAVVPLDDDEAPAPGATPEEAFDAGWAHALLDQAVRDLRDELDRSGKSAHFGLFDRYDLNPPASGAPTYADLAREFGLKETDVTNHLRACRQRLRELIEKRVRDTLGPDGDAAAEIREVFR